MSGFGKRWKVVKCEGNEMLLRAEGYNRQECFEKIRELLEVEGGCFKIIPMEDK